MDKLRGELVVTGVTGIAMASVIDEIERRAASYHARLMKGETI
jgi:hypothetical protein